MSASEVGKNLTNSAQDLIGKGQPGTHGSKLCSQTAIIGGFSVKSTTSCLLQEKQFACAALFR